MFGMVEYLIYCGMKKIGYTLILLFAAVFAGCGGGEKTIYKIENVEFTLSGPLFEGSNPAQYTYAVDLKSILGDKYADGSEITGAVLKSAQIVAADSANFDGINSFVVSLAGDNPELKMVELAVLNPIAPGSTKVTLIPSLEANADDYFKEKQFYIVVDAGLAADMEGDITFKGTFEFELTYH
jgi:hypothetical protein